MKGDTINLEEVIDTLKAKWKFILLITLSTTILFGILSFFVIKPKYESSTKLFIGKENVSVNGDYNSSDIDMYQKLMKTYSQVITSSDLVETALIRKNIPAEVEEVLKNLKIETSTDTQILQVKYQSTDAYVANDIVNAIKGMFIVRATELIPNGNIQVIEESKVSKNPVSPNKGLNIAVGFLIGFVISMGLVMLSIGLNNSFRNKDEIERILGVSVIGTIPLTKGK